MCEDTTYHKTEGIIRLAIEELLSKVSRLRCERDECAIDHAVTRSPSMTRDALHPVRCFLLLICIGPLNGVTLSSGRSTFWTRILVAPVWRMCYGVKSNTVPEW